MRDTVAGVPHATRVAHGTAAIERKGLVERLEVRATAAIVGASGECNVERQQTGVPVDGLSHGFPRGIVLNHERVEDAQRPR
eukprot:3088990-Prymnesium_polylepis.1